MLAIQEPPNFRQPSADSNFRNCKPPPRLPEPGSALSRRLGPVKFRARFTLVALSLLGCCGCAERPATVESVSELTVDEAPTGSAEGIDADSWVFDFGTTLLLPNQIASRTIQIRNTSSSPVEFLEPEVTCGCVRAELEPRRLEPGASAELTASARPVKFGPINHNVLLKSKGPEQIVLEFAARGELIQRLQTVPRELHLGHVDAEQHVEQTVWAEIGLLPDENEAPELSVSGSADSVLALRPTGRTDRILRSGIARQRTEYQLQLDAPGEARDARSFVDFKIADASFRMPVTWKISPFVEPVPSQVAMRFEKDRDSSERQVLIRYRQPPGQPPAVSSQSVENGTMSAEISPTTTATLYNLNLKVQPDNSGPVVRGAVSVQTNDSRQPVVKVKFYGLVANR